MIPLSNPDTFDRPENAFINVSVARRCLTSREKARGASISFLLSISFGIPHGISPREINYRCSRERAGARWKEKGRVREIERQKERERYAHTFHGIYREEERRICSEVLRIYPHTNRVSSSTAITRSANDSAA